MVTLEAAITELQAGFEAARASANHTKADMLLLLATMLGTLILGFTPDVGALAAWATCGWGSAVGAILVRCRGEQDARC
jgi:hypothetical protein